MPKGKQESVTLGTYHQFVVRQLSASMGKSVSQVIGFMVESWVAEHQPIVRDAKATLQDFRSRRKP